MISKIIKLCQTSPRIFYVSLLIAFALAVFIFALWQEIFDFQVYLSVITTVISWLWMVVLFISTVHIWQGKLKKRLGEISYIICLSVTLSGFWMLVFYPAVMSYDALEHWKQALKNQYTTWHPPILAMLMHVTQFFSNSPSLFSFIQGLLFWSSIFYLIRQVIPQNKPFLLSCSFIICLPPLWLYSNVTISNTWMSTFALLAIALVIKSIRQQEKLLFLLSVISISIAVMFRRDAIFFVFPQILIYLLFFRYNKNFFKIVGQVILIFLVVFLPAKIIEFSPNVIPNTDNLGNVITDANPAGHGLLIKYVGTVVYAKNFMSESEINAERQSIDQEFGTGTFDKAIEGYLCYSGNYLVWNRHVPAVVKKFGIKSNFVIDKLVHLAIRHPMGLINHQSCYFSHFSQFSDLYYQNWGVLEEDTHMDNKRSELGIPLESKLPAVKTSYINLVNMLIKHPQLNLLFKHYIFLIFSVISLLVGLLIHKIELIIPTLFILVYPVAYLIVGPSPSWRYLFFCYLCSWIVLLTMVSYIWELRKKTS